jgi:hypothetical protein
VEGACPGAAAVATEDGHSKDETLSVLKDFKKQEDFDDKVIIVTAEQEGHSNGFWIEKDEMSQAYAKRATGNYLWQVDHDEFYKHEDLNTICELLEKQPDITSMNFRTLNFWGSLRHKVDGMWLRCGDHDFQRLFAWGPGFQYATHRPPTVIDNQGRNQKDIKHVSATIMAREGIYLYHYEYLFPFQVKNKTIYYSNRCQGSRHSLDWFNDCYMNLSKPFKVHNIMRWLSWLEVYAGIHPHQVENMMNEVSNNYKWITVRRTDDLDILTKNIWYNFSILMLKFISLIVRVFYTDLRFIFKKFFIDCGLWPFVQRLRGRAIDGSLKSIK